MILKCNNIGKLSSVEVEINTITLIAGLNNTGKSTIGKLLYSFFNTFYKFDERTNKELKSLIRSSLLDYEIDDISILDECIDELYSHRFEDNNESIHKIIKKYLGRHENTIYNITKNNDNTIKHIINILNLTDSEIHRDLLQRNMYSEFGNQIQNVFFNDKESSTSLQMENSTISVSIQNNKIYSLTGFHNFETEAIYIDDPFILDAIPSVSSSLLGGITNLLSDFFLNGGIRYTTGHKTHLSSKLLQQSNHESDNIEDTIKNLVIKNSISKILNLIDSVCEGNLILEKKIGLSYRFSNDNKSLAVKNLSTGLKTFMIIKTLLLNGSLIPNGTIILDEPEIHLHPEWQKLLAEIIVLLQKELGMHILINSHSPYFINSIDIYAQKYKIRKTCKFYLAKDIENNNSHFSELIDVSNNIEDINRLLFIPLQNLENERAQI